MNNNKNKTTQRRDRITSCLPLTAPCTPHFLDLSPHPPHRPSKPCQSLGHHFKCLAAFKLVTRWQHDTGANFPCLHTQHVLPAVVVKICHLLGFLLPRVPHHWRKAKEKKKIMILIQAISVIFDLVLNLSGFCSSSSTSSVQSSSNPTYPWLSVPMVPHHWRRKKTDNMKSSLSLLFSSQCSL